MSALVIDYKELATISSHANDLAKKQRHMLIV